MSKVVWTDKQETRATRADKMKCMKVKGAKTGPKPYVRPNHRPRKFESPEEMYDIIEEYFDSCYKEVEQKDGSMKRVVIRPITMTGLCLALDVTMNTLKNYEKRYEAEYKDVIGRAFLHCQNACEERLFANNQCTGAIFNLKCNYGWRDNADDTEKSTTTMNINFGSKE